MSHHDNGKELIPSARRLIKSLRDMGYDFSSAVADLVDNSIEGGSTLVAIDIEFDGDDSWVRIADNGKGMSPTQLLEAMRYGAEREYDKEDLGKFGLGLKTASLSQCQRLSVASRMNPGKADISAYCWDISYIEKTNRWEVIPIEWEVLGPAILGPLEDTTGTVVLWQKLDRILGYKQPYGESARRKLSVMCRDVEEHLGMVFHRFLGGEVRGMKLKILLNGNVIKPWDPFVRDEQKIKVLTPVTLKLEHEGVSGEIKLEPYVLPHQSNFSSPEAFKRASGPSSWNQQQGFYIYRAGRLIQSGGWCRLRTADEHTKLARVALSFSPVLDDAFKVNVAKMRVQLPSQLREQIEQAIKPALKIAQENYRKSPVHAGIATTPSPSVPHKELPTVIPVTQPSESPKTAKLSGELITPTTQTVEPAVIPSGAEDENLGPSGAQRLWTLEELHSRIEGVAEPDEWPVINNVFNRFRALIERKS